MSRPTGRRRHQVLGEIVVTMTVPNWPLGKLGFEGVDPAATGRPSYHPATPLKSYIYGPAQCCLAAERGISWRPLGREDDFFDVID